MQGKTSMWIIQSPSDQKSFSSGLLFKISSTKISLQEGTYVLSKHNFFKEDATDILIGHFFIVQDYQTIQRCSASLVPGHELPRLPRSH